MIRPGFLDKASRQDLIEAWPALPGGSRHDVEVAGRLWCIGTMV